MNNPTLPLFSGQRWQKSFLKLIIVGGTTLVLGLTVQPLRASNILLNPSFEASSGAWPPVAPASWTYYGPGENFYIEPTGPVEGTPHTGNNMFKIWGTVWTAGTPNWTGVYQGSTCAPGWTYAADGWFRTRTGDAMGADNRAWIEVSFRDSTNGIIALYKSEEFGSSWGVDSWHHLFVTNVCDLGNNNVVTGSVTQLVAPLGTASVRYQYVHYQINNNGGACQFDDAVLDQLVGPVPPVLSNVSPGNKLFANASAGFTFTASSPSSTPINDTGIGVVVNGSNVSAGLTITGSATSKNVSYMGLLSNKTYVVSITVTDTVSLTTSGNYEFDTFAPVFLWECEDFDFTNGMWIANPELVTTNGNPNSYFGKVGVQGVDENDLSAGSGDHFYRADDPMGTTYSGDLPRQKFVDAGVQDYKVGWFNAGEWVNFTRIFPAGTYNIYGRLGGGAGAATATLSKVEAGPTVTDLGTFSFTGRGWNTYDYVPLMDTNGNLVALTLGGLQTLRFTTGGGADPNFLMLVPAAADLPLLSGIYPNGAQPFQFTNKFTFTVTSSSTAVPDSGIKLLINGEDVSASLQITGSSLVRNVVYPSLPLNAILTSVIAVTNANDVGISRTNRFDTFDPANRMVEAEDYDFGGGQYINNPTPGQPFPDGYLNAVGTTNVDYEHTFADGQEFWYRGDPNIPNQVASDYLRQKFVDTGASDYNLGWFGYPDWANYTRDYAAGNYRIYGRFAGSGGYTMYLDAVVSGAGTTTQVLKRLGRWGAVGRDWQAFDWVPLTDEGLVAPVVLKLGGVQTLRISTTGNCNPNYLMLVPVGGINVSAALSGANVIVSFPTQAGLTYRVLYRGEAASGNWVLLTTVAGDGTTKSVSDPAIVGGQRFYQVVAP